MSVYSEIKDYHIAWAAGFFDGEGCATILKQVYRSSDGRKKHSHRVHVAISQNNYEVLQTFKDVIGIHAKIFKRKLTVTTVIL